MQLAANFAVARRARARAETASGLALVDEQCAAGRTKKRCEKQRFYLAKHHDAEPSKKIGCQKQR
jgi:hypothetical protein